LRRKQHSTLTAVISILGEGQMSLPYSVFFFIPRKFFGCCVEEGQIKNYWGESGGKGCMYIKDWFKPVVTLFQINTFIK
jgi:hypothetical protein